MSRKKLLSNGSRNAGPVPGVFGSDTAFGVDARMTSGRLETIVRSAERPDQMPLVELEVAVEHLVQLIDQQKPRRAARPVVRH